MGTDPQRGPGWRLGLIASLVLAATPLAQAGGSAAGVLMVHAVVPRHASIRFAPPSFITVSESDVARGYVDVESPVDVAVRSNEPRGYALLLQALPGAVRQARVLAPQGSLAVGGAGAIFTRPATGPGTWTDRIQLRFRFELAPDAQPGLHPWPLRVSMLPQ